MSAAVAISARAFTFDAASHIYRLDGQRIPNVTMVLEKAGIIDYSRIPGETREKALLRGKAVHLATQYDDEFTFGFNPQPLDEDTVDPEQLGYLGAWRKFLQASKFRPTLIEHRDWHPAHSYAGTLDRLGAFDGNSQYKLLLDIKTGTAEEWTKIQLASYAAFFDNPRSYLRLSVELHADETYKARSYSGGTWQADFNDFLHCLNFVRSEENAMQVRRKYGNSGG